MSRHNLHRTAAEDPVVLNSPSRAEMWFLLSVFVLSLALRLYYHFEMRGNVLTENLQLDELFHDRWAKAIAAGDVMGEGVFFRAPLYPYLLGLSYWMFGNIQEIPRLLQHLCGSLLVLLIYFQARILFGVRAAVIASLLGMLYGVMMYFEGRLLFDFPLTFLVLGWLTLVTYYADRRSWIVYAGIGFLFGLICIMRPTFLALAPFLLGYVLWNRFKTEPGILRSATVLAAGFLLPILVVTIRNAVAGGEFVLIASQGGINFYIGNNPQSDGMSSWIPEAGEVWGDSRQLEYLAEQALGRVASTSEVSSYWYAKGWEYLRVDPAGFIGLFLKKVYLFWSHIEIANNLSYYWFERASVLLRVLPVGFWLAGPLGLAGAALAWKNPGARLLVLFLLLYCLVTAMFFVTDRFRLPVVPGLCVFSGYAMHRLFLSVMTRNGASFLHTTALIGAGALIVNTNFTRLHADVSFGDEALQGYAALQSGDLKKAVQLLDRPARFDPDNSTIRINQGIALWGLGKTGDAAEAFRAAIRGNPYSAFINLAHLYYNNQETDSAWAYAGRAMKARPFAPGGYIIAAKVMIVVRNDRQAEEVLRAGIAACRDNFMYGEYLLAGISMQNGNIRWADSLYRRVLRQTGQLQQPEYSLGSEKEQFGEDLRTLRAKSLHGLGRVFALYGRLDSSQVYLRSAAELLPTKGDIWADWGVCLLRLNRLAEADTVMRRAVALSAANPSVWLNYATVLARRGDLPKAGQAASRALTLKPDFEEARRLLDALHRSQKR